MARIRSQPGPARAQVRNYTESVWRAPKIVNLRTDAQPHIDAHNRRRQHDLAIEKRVHSPDGFHRIQCTLLGMIGVNAYLLWMNVYAKPSKKQDMMEWIEEACLDLIMSTLGDEATRAATARRLR